MKLPDWLTKKRILYLAILIFLVGFVSLYCSKAKASDCPCPPEKTVAVPPKPQPKPKPLPPTPPTVPKGPTRSSNVPHETIRPLVGGGVSYGQEHNLDPHIFGGMQFPKDSRGGNWQLQIGGSFERRNAIDATCTIRCRSCEASVGGWTDERAVVSGVYVF